MRGGTKSWHSPMVLAVLALSLVLVPLVLALPGGGRQAPANRPVAQEKQLPQCTIIGTQGDDVLVGTSGNDVICGLGGNDVIHGRGGDDILFGSFGDDVLDGGPGNDELRGHWGRDRLLGGPGDDLLHGGGNADLLSGGPGADTADYSTRVHPVRVTIGRGGANDGVTGENDDVRNDVENVFGGANDDTLVGSSKANRLDGRGGNDDLMGAGGSDDLFGGPGVDRLDGRDAARFRDMLNCGSGRGDSAVADSRDRVMGNCEKSNQPKVANRAPTDILLTPATVAEHQHIGTLVGTLSAVDPDAGDRHKFRLVGGDTGAFRVANDKLRTAQVFDFKTKSSYSVRVRVTDRKGAGFEKNLTITVTVVGGAQGNSAPTDVTLTPATIAENQPAGSTVGTLAATDADAGQAHSFALVAGAGDTDNAAFMVSGNQLQSTQFFDFENKSSYSIRVATTDAASATFAKALTVTIRDVNDAPTDLSLSPSTIAENEPAGTTVGTLTATDADAGQAHTFALVAGPGDADNAAFTITGNQLRSTQIFDFENKNTYSIRVETTDPAGATFAKALTVTITDVPTEADDKTITGISEDAGATTIGLSGRDADGDALTFTVVSGPQHGTLDTTTPAATCNGAKPSGCTASVAYTPTTNFNGSDSFTYKVNDGTEDSLPASVSITVDPVNDTPAAADANVTTDEGTPLAIDLAALVSDVETTDANLTYTIVTPPTNGSLTGSGGARTYTPTADLNGPDSFTYRVTDRGDPDNCGAPGPACDGPKTSSTHTVSITVDPVNDAPVNFLPAGPVIAVQNTDTPIAGLSVADVDAGTDEVKLTLSALQGTLTVSTSVFGGVGTLQVAGNTTKAVVITASLAQINTTLANANGLVYHGDAAYTGPDTLTMATDDLGHTGSGGAKTDTDTLALNVLPPNQTPVADAKSVSTSEDTPLSITLSATDADGDPLTFAIAGGPGQGVLGPIGPVTCGATPNVCTASITYTPNANANGPDSFTFSANDGRATSPPATVSITVNPVNDAPSLANIEAGALAYTENDPATVITTATTVSDVDSANFDTGTLTVDYTAGGSVDDRLEIRNEGTGAGQIGVSGTTVMFAGTAIGTVAGGSGTTPLVVTLNADATPAATQALIRNVTYRNVSDTPTTTARTVRFVLSDGDGGTSNAATRGVTVTAVNDAPVLAGVEATAVSYVESVDSAPSQSQVTNTLTVSDVDSTNLTGATVQITAGCQTGEDSLVFSTQNGITGSYNTASCTLTLTGSSSAANYQTALRSINYRDSSDAPITTTRTVTFQVDDGQSANHASNTQTRDVTVTASNDSPTGAADTFNGTNSALAGVTLAVSTSPSTPNVAVTGTVLSNDTDPDTAHANLTAAAGTSSTNGGVVAVNADGTFSYTPAPGFTGSDTFTYTVHDNGSPDRTATATVTINVAGPRVWFVNPGGAAGGNGTSALPLNSLAPLSTGGGSDSLDGNGDVVFVNQGTGNATSGGFVLEASQQLVGQPQGLSVTNANGTYNLVTAGGANPTITNSAGAGLTLADGNTIQRVNVTNSTGVGVTGNAIGTLTYGANTTISGNAGGGLALSGAAGGAISIGADITSSSGRSVSIANRSSGTTSLTGAISDTGTGISLTSNTGATVSFTGTLNATTGANDAFTATGGGTINVNTGATRALTTTTGTALTLNGVGGTISLTDLDKNGGGTGISLTNAGASVTIPSGAAIAGTTTAGVTIDQGTGAFSYAGTISNAAGRTVQVTNRNTGSPGLVQFTGSVTSTGGTGVNLDNNDNGTINFGGGLVLSTGANAAFGATNGGTVNVDNTSVTNTLTTTTGTALSVANTTIGSTGLKFQSISANGAASGIVLNNTGSSGSLTVTGAGNTSQGGDNSGGTIQSTTSFGVSLTNTTNPSFRNLRILNTGDSGINGTQVSGFSFTDGTITGAGDASDENSITFDDSLTSTPNLTGAVTITNNVISQTEAEGVDIENWGGTISDANISNNALSDTGDVATPGSAITLVDSGLATSAATITKATIAGNTITDFRAGVGVQVRAGNPTAGGPTGSAGAAGSATNIISVTGNSMDGGNGGVGNQPDRFFTGGVSGNGGQGNFNVSNNGTAANRLRNIDCIAIEMQMDGPVTMTSTIQNNFINANSAVGCAGIAVGTDDPNNLGAGTHSTLISGNNVMGTDGPGIFPIVRASGSTMFARVLNNTVAAPITTNAARAGIRVDSGSATGDTTMCLEIAGNTTAGSTNNATATTSPGINLRKQGTDPAVNTFGIEGMSATSSPGVENYVNGLNTSTSGTFGTGGTALLSATAGFTSCTAP